MKKKIIILLCTSLGILLLGIAVGSVYQSPMDIFYIISAKIFNIIPPKHITPASVSIVWNLRLPRVLLAFIAGSALSMSGAAIQSILKNPLASPYTLGISSGASLGACFTILYGLTFPILPMLTLPSAGFIFGLGTIFFVITFSSHLDHQMQNNTIILTGMVLSLFINAVTTLLSALKEEHLQQLIFWQMGTFSMKDWSIVLILMPVLIIGTAVMFHYHLELDMMTFGEEQAVSMGIELKKIKWHILLISSVLTGATIAFVGIIGFVDLISPHIVRRLFGSSHKYVIPLSGIFGGTLMVLCDLTARTIVSPSELPVGAVTAILGAPFFIYLYFGRKKVP